MGLVVGLAAQQSFSNLLVGLQIAFTQPIRLDDVVIIEGEWGRIEEITATYAVIRIWDLRRMVVPLTYFIEKPFQNWTRVSADLLGTVYIYTDYSAEVDIIREELHRLLKSSEKWDGKVWGLQVTDATEKTIQLRALMSAADSSAAWDLRCEIREKLIGYIQKEFPDSLPALKISDGIPDRTDHENN
jgi:small-conductance mechanosensitive channel